MDLSTEPGNDGAAEEIDPGLDPVISEVENTPPTSAWSSPTLVVAGFVLVALVGQAIRCHLIGKPITFDVANYQYYTGYAEIHGFGSPLSLPGGLETYLDPQLNTLYYLVIDYLPARLAVYGIAALQSLVVAAVGVLVWGAVRRTSTSELVPILAGLVAAAGAYFAPIYAIETGETSSDALLAILVFAAAALLFQVVGNPVGRSAYLKAAAAGVIIGIDAELKFTQAAFGSAMVIGLAVALVLGRRMSGRTLKHCGALLAAVALPAVIVAAALYLPEGVFLWHRFHDPLFPFYNGVFHSPDLRPGDFSPGYVARTPTSLWQHFSQLLVSGANAPGGWYQWKLRSPVLFFSLVVVVASFVFDLVKRTRPQALFLEISFILGFLLWAVLFGFYRYLAPLEMGAVAVVVLIVFLHWPEADQPAPAGNRLHQLAQPLAVLVVAVALLAGAPFSVYSRLGNPAAFGASYFEIPAHTFAPMAGDGIVLAGSPLGYLVPQFPADSDIVSVGGSAEQVMSKAWWKHVKSVVEASHRQWWLVQSGLSEKATLHYLAQIGFPRRLGVCRTFSTAVTAVEICGLPQPD